ncbi:hypothetical protein EDB80DRAFT_737563 [Ilyonectria destructans]|nr:hypothetical protein EDB80DRAFT_737563 [Ilyonectria destructans]
MRPDTRRRKSTLLRQQDTLIAVLSRNHKGLSESSSIFAPFVEAGIASTVLPRWCPDLVSLSLSRPFLQLVLSPFLFQHPSTLPPCVQLSLGLSLTHSIRRHELFRGTFSPDAATADKPNLSDPIPHTTKEHSTRTSTLRVVQRLGAWCSLEPRRPMGSMGSVGIMGDMEMECAYDLSVRKPRHRGGEVVSSYRGYYLSIIVAPLAFRKLCRLLDLYLRSPWEGLFP